MQVTEDVQTQQAALEPVFRSITAGLARDFAYVDGVGVRLPVIAAQRRTAVFAGLIAVARAMRQLLCG